MALNYRHIPVFNGQVQAVVFDWAGTVCDSGVFAPVLSFQKVFEEEGVPVTSDEVRGPMGVHKRTHIQKICQLPAVTERWVAKKSKEPTEDDVDRMYERYLVVTMDVLPTNSKLLKGTVETMAILRKKLGVKIGSTTGYTTKIMEKLMPLAAAEGYKPDCYVNSDEVPVARPSPSMILMNMVKLNIWSPKAVVKVDDSGAGITAGLHAGCWTVGIVKTGNYVAATEDELETMPKDVLKARMDLAERKFKEVGAHFIIDTISDLPPVIEEINKRLALGLSP